jgi:hypothetical protein
MAAATASYASAGMGALRDFVTVARQLSLLKRLGDVGIGALFHTPETVHLLVFTREEDNFDILRRRIGFQLATHLVAVFMWHDDVQHHEVWVLGLGLLHCFFTITRGDDVVPGGGEGFSDQLEGRGTVVNNKNFAHGLGLPLRNVSASARP